MTVVIKSPTPLPEKKTLTVFLAGPMKGVPHIHKTLEVSLKELKEELPDIVDSLKLP